MSSRTSIHSFARALLGALFVLAACGNPDNLVYGGVPPLNGAPDASIKDVHSAIHGSATVELAQPNGSFASSQMSVLALSSAPNLCSKLSSNPDYFKVASEQEVTLLLAVPPNTSGAIVMGLGHAAAMMETTTGSGAQLYAFGYVPGFGNISLSQLNLGPGGEAKGSFDVGIQGSDGTPHEVVGHFKTTDCEAFAGAHIRIAPMP